MILTFAEAVGARIQAHLDRRGLEPNDAAALCGVSHRTMRRLLKGERLRADTVDKVSDGLGLDWSVILKVGG